MRAWVAILLLAAIWQLPAELAGAACTEAAAAMPGRKLLLNTGEWLRGGTPRWAQANFVPRPCSTAWGQRA